MIKKLLLIAMLSSSSSVFAQVTDATRENYKNPKDEKGLCTSRNDDEWQSKRGYCKAIQEQLTMPGCAHETIERIRQRYLKSIKGELKNEKDEMSLGDFECSSSDQEGRKTTSMQDIAKSPQDFAYVITQLFSIIAIEESDWNDEANKGGAVEGLLGLKKSDMADKRYSCGCDTKNQPNIPPDRPLDGHQNMICGMYMALYWADKDGQIYNSVKPKPGKPKVPKEGAPTNKAGEDDPSSPKGFARIFKSLEYDRNDKASERRHTWMQNKMQNFCKTYKPGSQTTSWKRALEDIDASALENRTTTPATR